jgi:hypothetical protein
MLRFNRAGRVVRFAPFNVNAREALAARLGLLPFLRLVGTRKPIRLATYEPVSTPQFPPSREINREFFNFGPSYSLEVAIRLMIQWT